MASPAPAPAAKRPKYEAKDLATKVQVLKALQAGASRKEVMEKFSVKKSTLSSYVKNEAQILQAYDGDMFGDKRKRLRTAAHPKLEEALLRWIAISRDAQLPLSGPLICAQAEKFALTMNIDSFNASEGWFDRFKKRQGLVFRNVCEEKGAVDESVVRDWRSGLSARLSTYEPCNIFNADETALFFKALPDKTIAFKGDPCVGGKRSKERVTVLLAANMTGTERLPLLVIGKAAKPRCFKNIKQLPVDYRYNRKAWMTAEIFQAWLRQLDRRFAAKDRKVLFVLDNCSAHTKVSGLDNIELLFLPPNTTNTTASLQPMDQGIIQFVKSRYRRHVLERMLLCMEAGKPCEVSLLSAIHMLTYVWNNTPPEVVANCFRHSGFVLDAADPDVADAAMADPDVAKEQDGRYVNIMPADVPLCDYFAIDSDVAVAGKVTDSDIVAEVLDGEGESADEDPSESGKRPRHTMTEAAHALAVLEDICMISSDSVRGLSHLQEVRKIVISAQISSAKQTAITDFFKK